MQGVLYEPFELAFTAAREWPKPFVQVRVTAVFTAPSGRSCVVDGFHDGGRTVARTIRGDRAGRWSWRVASEPRDDGLAGEGAVDVTTDGASRGFLRATPGRAFGFAWSDGSPTFLLGDTMYNLPAYAHSGFDPVPLLERRLAQGMDWIRIRAHCSATHRRPHRHSDWMGADVWPWGGIAQDPDFEVFNLRWFATLDRVVVEAQRRGIALETHPRVLAVRVPVRRSPPLHGRGRGSLDPLISSRGTRPTERS